MVSDGDRDLWPGPTPEVRDSQTHTAIQNRYFQRMIKGTPGDEVGVVPKTTDRGEVCVRFKRGFVYFVYLLRFNGTLNSFI